jgi:opine dehydrogenase
VRHPPVERIAVLGSGDAGRALAAAFAASGYDVALWNRSGERIDALGGATVRLIGPDAATTPIQLAEASTDLAAVCAHADVILLAVTSSAQPELVARLWPLAPRARAVVLVPGHTGGIFAARQVLGRQAEAGVIAEMPLPFVCRGTADGAVHIRQYKRDVPLAALPDRAPAPLVRLLAGVFPAVRPAANPWECGLGNTTAILQPVLALANLARIDRGERFGIYTDGVSPAVGRLVAALDRERLLLAEAMGLNLPSVAQWFGRVYGAHGESVEDCLADTAGYAGIAAPDSVRHRFLTEHVRTGAVPMRALAAAAGTPHAALDALIELSSAAVGVDLRASGRSLACMGLDVPLEPAGRKESR